MINPKKIIEPVIKWSGSKRYVAPELSRHIGRQTRYIEPFIGGGAIWPVFFSVFPRLLQGQGQSAKFHFVS